MTTPLVRRFEFALVVLGLGLRAPAAFAQVAQSASGAVRGLVSDSAGGAIAGATIFVLGSELHARTAESGAFRLDKVPVGRVRLEVRRFGFAPRIIEAEVLAGVDIRLDVLLSSIPQRLEVVEVRERPSASNARLAGYNERRLKKVGYFITRERIDAANSRRLTDLLSQVPGVRFFSQRGGPTHSVRLRGARCPPLVFLDGSPATSGEFDLDNVDPGTVEGIEVYPDMMSIPPELLGPRDLDRCGVIAIWSRPFRPRAQLAKRAEGDAEQLVARKIAFLASEVDVPARLEPGTGIPFYPESLWNAAVDGRAMLEFMVDSAGTILMETIQTVSSTHQLFTMAARDALNTAEFSPALRGGQRVAQIVQLPFIFTAPPKGRTRRPPN
jgi:TonB family protein